MKQKPPEKICCPFCSHTFSLKDQGCGGKCGLFGKCGLCCCPRCGYSFVPESKTVQFFKDVFGKKNEKEPKP